MKDFTYHRLEILLQSLSLDGYHPVSFRQFLENHKSNEKRVIIRHDIDRNLKNALKMAGFEQSLGIRASYYFRYPTTFNPEIIRRIAGYGHEIGYHYEVLAKAGGDFDTAFRLFDQELAEFRRICEVKTCCAHGSPLSAFDNRTLFSHRSFSDFDLIGDAHLSVSPEIPYFTDTGRSWGMQENLRDRLDTRKQVPDIRSTDELQEHLRNSDYREIYLVIHPERWNDPGIRWYLQYGRDVGFNMGKYALRKVR
jgi:hypothetical protein